MQKGEMIRNQMGAQGGLQLAMHDAIVIGGGPAGSTAAALLARRGHSVVLLERERFPRFQVGESLLPYNNDLFARLGVTDQLRAGEFFPKYGAAFVTGDGAIGYTFRFDSNLAEPYQRSFQVRRSEFDHLLLRNARDAGADVREETAVTRVDLDDPQRAVVETAKGERIEGRFVLDASGHGALLGNRLGKKTDVASLKKIAIFAHYDHVPRAEGRDAGNTVIVVLRNAWFWMIPVTAETMSVGLVLDRQQFLESGLQPEEILTRTIATTPYLAERMQVAERITPVYARKDFSYRMQTMVGPNFALIGDAAGFLDPIFSTGVFLAMKSADLATTAFLDLLATGRMTKLRAYQRDMIGAQEKYFRFISHFYRREFLEVFLQPKPDYDLVKPIVSVLAGDVFSSGVQRWKLALFFLLVKIQKWRRGIIAPGIEWDSLPSVASAT
jgi:flavin-dependent dehydrogenase